MKDYDFCPKYLLHAHADNESIFAIFDAMNELEWKSKSCVWFQYRQNKEKNYIRFISEYGLAIMYNIGLFHLLTACTPLLT